MTTIVIDITNERQTANKSIDRLQKSLEKMQRQMDKLFYQKSELPSDKFSDAMEKTMKLAVDVSVVKVNQVYDTAKETSGYAQPKQTEASQRIVQAIDRMAQSIEDALAPQVIDGMMNGALDTGKEMFSSIKQGFGKFKEGFSFLNSDPFKTIKEAIPEFINQKGAKLEKPIGDFFGAVGKIGDNFMQAKTKLSTSILGMGMGAQMIGDVLSQGSDTFIKGVGTLIQGVGFLTQGIGFFLNKGISGVVESIGKGIKYAGTSLQSIGSILLKDSGNLKKCAGIAAKGIGFLTSGVGSLFGYIGEVVGYAEKGIGKLVGGIGKLVGFASKGIQDFIPKVSGKIGTIGQVFVSGFGIVTGIVKGIFSFIGGAIKAAWTGVQNLIVKPIISYEGSLSASTGYNQLFKFSDLYSKDLFKLTPSGDTSDNTSQMQKHTDWSVQGVNNYVEEMKNGDYTPTDPAVAFENMLNGIGMSGVYSLDSTTGIGMRYLNAGKTADRTKEEITYIQDASAAFNLSEQGYQEFANRVLQLGESDTVSLQDITQGMGNLVPAIEMITKGLGETVDAAGIAKVKERIKNGQLSGEQAKEALFKTIEEYYSGVAEELSNSTVSGLKTKLGNLFQGNIVKRWARGLTEGLQSGAKKGLVSVGEFINEHKDTFEELGNIAQGIGNSLGEFGLDAIKNTITRMETLFASTEFKEGDLSDKMKMFWDDVIKKPFDEWWQNTGSPLVNGVLDVVGEKMGQGLTGFLSILFGMDEKEALKDGENAGTGFTQGFARGFDGEKVMNAFADMLSKVIGKIWEDIQNKIWKKDLLEQQEEYQSFQEQQENVKNGHQYQFGYSGTGIGVTEEDVAEQKGEDFHYVAGIGYVREGTDNRLRHVVGLGIMGGETETNPTDTATNGMSPEDIATQQVIFDTQADHIKRRTEEGLAEKGFEGGIDKAIDNYNTLEEEQKRILDEGLQKMQALNEQFSFLGNPKYADIIVRIIGAEGFTIDGRGGSITIGDENPYKKDPDSVLYPYAKGGILTSPHVGLVAEAGPEAIIPLSGANKSNGISLWEQAGYILGTLPKHAEGGIFGEINEEKNGRSSFLSNNFKEEANNAESVSNITAPIQVNTNITGMNFTFQGAQAGDKEGIMQVIKEQMPTIADEIAGTIAVNIQRIFANMKKGAV